jgi:hypothetical protein
VGVVCIDKYSTFRTDIAYLVKPRILIPNVSQCYEDIVQNKNNVSDTISLFYVRKCKLPVSSIIVYGSYSGVWKWTSLRHAHKGL